MSEISIKAEEIFHLGSWPVTNAVLLSFTAVALLFILLVLLRARLAVVPGKFQNFFELLFEEVLKMMDMVLGSRHLSLKYLPLIATIFLFVLTSNWLGLLPFIGPLGIKTEHSFIPLFRAPASDLNFTIALAVISVLGVNLAGVVALGLKRHWEKFLKPSHSKIRIEKCLADFEGLIRI